MDRIQARDLPEYKALNLEPKKPKEPKKPEEKIEQI
jgi:hypothetical protein